MLNILFLNHSAKHCGVYQYGLRLYTIVSKSTDINYIYKEINTLDEYINLIKTEHVNGIIYNYHGSTMRWLNKDTIQKTVINIGMPHESSHNMFDIIVDLDPSSNSPSNYYKIPRPIFENIEFDLTNATLINRNFITEYTDTNIPIFGSFGFGFSNKGFDKIIKIVNDQYDEAVIKLIITNPTFYANPHEALHIGNMCKAITVKPGIKVMVTHEFFSDDEILFFLNSNTMNIFLYDTMNGRGISSVIDYALSVKTPIGISNSFMFRHVYSDKICLYKTSIKDCLQTTAELDKFRERNSNHNLIAIFDNIIKKNIKN